MLTPRNADDESAIPVYRRARRLGLATLFLATAPIVAAVWIVPTFVTQDGPAHLYNAEILARSFGPNSPFRPYFSVRWQPLPNWAGHLALMGLVSAFPPRVADRLMTSATFVLFACAVAWLRYRVAGWRGMPLSAIVAGILAANVTWLFGFTSFLLGAALFPVTLAVWWAGRDRTDGFARRALALAALVAFGYFCHLVSLGLTALGLVVLELSTPGRNRRARAICTALGLLPLLPLGVLYLGLVRQGGGIAAAVRPPSGMSRLPPRSWLRQLSWVDPISIARRDVAPFLEGVPFPLAATGLSPVVWFVLGLGLLGAATLPQQALERLTLGLLTRHTNPKRKRRILGRDLRLRRWLWRAGTGVPWSPWPLR